MHGESHRSDRIGWLRATVLGANDGLISTSSLVVGVAAAGPDRAAILLAAGLLTQGVAEVTLALLLALGGVAGHLGGAPVARGAFRVAFWGAVAMGCTGAVGRIFGAVA